MKLVTRERILTLSMLLGAAAAILLGSFTVFAKECEEYPQKLFRLHILANSDSREDQQLKYDLRDYIMEDMTDIFDGCKSSEEAKNRAKENLSVITKKAQRFIYDKGYDYVITASVEKTYFTTRQYGGLVVPAGEYDALRIVIGEGEGHNWWCVMFPPLCLGAVEKYESADEDLFICKPKSSNSLSPSASREIEGDRPVQIRFALFEWIQKLF